MILWTLILGVACTEPGMLEAVAQALADGAVADGGAGLRLMTGVTGVIAEACTAGDVDGYTFSGPSASALGITTADVTGNDDATVTWTFLNVGLDGALGTLLITTDQDMSQLVVAWTGDEGLFGAGLVMAECEEVTRALITGTGSWQANGASSTINLLGVAPDIGIGYAPTAAIAPTAGQLRATSDRDGWVILLDDAAGIDPTAGTWPGTATGSNWEHTVELALP